MNEIVPREPLFGRHPRPSEPRSLAAPRPAGPAVHDLLPGKLKLACPR